MRKFVPLIVGCLLVAGCASKPESDPAYVSPTQYDTYSCDQMRAEVQRVTSQIDQQTKSDNGNQILNTALSAWAIYNGQGAHQNVELKRAQNKYRILDEMMIKKNCTN